MKKELSQKCSEQIAYEAPALEVCTILVESGIAVSPTGQSSGEDFFYGGNF